MWLRFARAVACGEESEWDSDSLETSSGWSTPSSEDHEDSDSDGGTTNLDLDLGCYGLPEPPAKPVNVDDRRETKHFDTVCAFCKQELPEILPLYLQGALSKLMLPENSTCAAGMTHPNGRIYISAHGFDLFCAFCGGHQDEIKVSEDWPDSSNMELDELPARVLSLRAKLLPLAIAPSKSMQFRELVGFYKEEGLKPRTCKSAGHAGYFGELGAMIIMQSLRDMFPSPQDAAFTPDQIHLDPQLIKPRGHFEFLDAFLLPHTSILLIQSDFNCSWKSAKQAWSQSHLYGLQMFPDPDKARVKEEPDDDIVILDDISPQECCIVVGYDNQGQEVEVLVIDD
ncbi:hypothetical protein K439DRAFT_1622536 [Ramaria rubella]|nr:hypothetical protein K439DRAFT_1622536 [Ramaria rubella]